jgi:putative exporter of polyketide antibiotics
MKILKSFISGARISVKSWRGMLIAWLLTLILVSLVAIPFKGALNGAFGNSMITEKLAEGFNTELFTDLGPTLKVIVSFFSSGLLFLLFISFFMNIFLSGGFFSSLRKGNSLFTIQEFFRSSSRNFWSFVVITLITRLILNFITGIVIAVPIIVITTSENISTEISIIIASVSGLVSIVVIPVMLLVADYARARQVSDENPSCFQAIGFGFSEVFRKFWSSYPLMLAILLVQIIFILLVFKTIPAWRPVSGTGIILLFLVSQFLFFIRIFLKVWRYGSVTALMQENAETSP